MSKPVTPDAQGAPDLRDEEAAARERRTQRWENEGGSSSPAQRKAKATAPTPSVAQANEGRFGAGAPRRTITQDEQDRLAHRGDDRR